MRSLRLVSAPRRATTITPIGALVLLLSRVAAAAPALQITSLRIEDAVQLALTRNERAKVSDLQVEVAQAGVERARAGFLPVIALSANDQQHLGAVGPAQSNVGTSNVTINQPIVNASAWPLYSQAKALALVSRPVAVPDATLHAAQEPPGQGAALVRLAIDRRPDVLAAKHAASAARDFANEPLLRLVPTLGVQGGLTATTSPPPTTGRWNDETLTATLTWTLYDAGIRYADKHARDAQALIADLTLQQLVRTVDAQVRSAIALLASAQAAFRVAGDAMQAARRSVEESAILYVEAITLAPARCAENAPFVMGRAEHLRGQCGARAFAR
jgi:outer membrane protein TolC